MFQQSLKEEIAVQSITKNLDNTKYMFEDNVYDIWPQIHSRWAFESRFTGMRLTPWTDEVRMQGWRSPGVSPFKPGVQIKISMKQNATGASVVRAYLKTGETTVEELLHRSRLHVFSYGRNRISDVHKRCDRLKGWFEPLRKLGTYAFKKDPHWATQLIELLLDNVTGDMAWLEKYVAKRRLSSMWPRLKWGRALEVFKARPTYWQRWVEAQTSNLEAMKKGCELGQHFKVLPNTGIRCRSPELSAQQLQQWLSMKPLQIVDNHMSDRPIWFEPWHSTVFSVVEESRKKKVEAAWLDMLVSDLKLQDIDLQIPARVGGMVHKTQKELTMKGWHQVAIDGKSYDSVAGTILSAHKSWLPLLMFLKNHYSVITGGFHTGLADTAGQLQELKWAIDEYPILRNCVFVVSADDLNIFFPPGIDPTPTIADWMHRHPWLGVDHLDSKYHIVLGLAAKRLDLDGNLKPMGPMGLKLQLDSPKHTVGMGIGPKAGFRMPEKKIRAHSSINLAKYQGIYLDPIPHMERKYIALKPGEYYSIGQYVEEEEM